MLTVLLDTRTFTLIIIILGMRCMQIDNQKEVICVAKKIKSDFHTHSNCSDGMNDPKELVNLYKLAGLEYACLADHNTVAGIYEARKYSRMRGVALIPGIEISSRNKTHILGLGIDIRNTALLRSCEYEETIHRNRAISQIEVLENNGFEVDRSVLKKNKGVITEYEIFLATSGNGNDFKEFSKKWLYKSSPYYIGIERKTVEEAIALIHKADGLAIWAHPGHAFKNNSAGLVDVIGDLVKMGLDGLEVFSSKHTHDQTWLLHNLAKKHNLAESGGSDYHGAGGRNLGNFSTYGVRFDAKKLVDLINKAK